MLMQVKCQHTGQEGLSMETSAPCAPVNVKCVGETSTQHTETDCCAGRTRPLGERKQTSDSGLQAARGSILANSFSSLPHSFPNRSGIHTGIGEIAHRQIVHQMVQSSI